MRLPGFLLPACACALLLSTAAAHASDSPPPQPAERAMDRLELEATSITGNRELPKVMSIVPWKSAEPPSGPDRPMGSLIEEVLAPVDRDEFRREITYFRDLASHSPPRTSPGAKAP
jgi:hypothetical protein